MSDPSTAEIERLLEEARTDLELDRVASVRARLPLEATPIKPWIRWAAIGGGGAALVVILALLWSRKHTDPPKVDVAPPVVESAPPPPTISAPETTAPIAPSVSASPPVVTAPKAIQQPAEDPIVLEHALLARARKALDTDPKTTLALVDEHARKYPHGTLESEREFLRISALARLGRMDEAKVARDRFIEKWPTSAYRERIESMTP
jgi:hypothetical protein